MTLKLVGADDKQKVTDDTPELALDAIYEYASQYEEFDSLRTEDCLGFALVVEDRLGMHIISGVDGYHQLVGQLEDAKQAVILNKMQDRLMGED